MSANKEITVTKQEEKPVLKRTVRYKEIQNEKSEIVLSMKDMKSSDDSLSLLSDTSYEKEKPVREMEEKIIEPEAEDDSIDDTQTEDFNGNKSVISTEIEKKKVYKFLHILLTAIVLLLGLVIVKFVLEILQLCILLFTDLTNFFCILGILILLGIVGYCLYRLFSNTENVVQDMKIIVKNADGIGEE